jgi:hypothetical protein
MLHNAWPQCQNLLSKGTTGGHVHEKLTGETTTRQQACYRACSLAAFIDNKCLNMLLYTVPEATRLYAGVYALLVFPTSNPILSAPRFWSTDVQILLLAACQTMEQKYLGPRRKNFRRRLLCRFSLTLSSVLLCNQGIQTQILTRF